MPQKKQTKKQANKTGRSKKMIEEAGTHVKDHQKTYVGITAVALFAMATYFFFGSKNASQNRETFKVWTLKAKAEVLERLEQAGILSREEYDAIIEKIGSKYEKLKSTTKSDVVSFKKEMKGYWPKIAESGKHTAKVAAKGAARAVAKDVVKNIATKVTSNSEPKTEEENSK